MKRLLAAVALLTRLPVHGRFDAFDIGRAMPFFPLVGAGIGVVLAGLLELAAPLFPPLLLSLTLIAAGIWVTGAIHLDGLADVADGIGGGHSREETLRIMRDPAVGSFGAIALVLVLGAKTAAISTLIERRSAVPYLVLAPTLGRWTMVALGRSLLYARSDGGLGAALREHGGRMDLVFATVMATVIAAAAAGIVAVPCWIAAAAVTVALRRLCNRRLGGFTGDALGANSELAEVAVLVTAVVLTR